MEEHASLTWSRSLERGVAVHHHRTRMKQRSRKGCRAFLKLPHSMANGNGTMMVEEYMNFI
eukprot:2207521-Lingulodinium_polyedra.AAC.1